MKIGIILAVLRESGNMGFSKEWLMSRERTWETCLVEAFNTVTGISSGPKEDLFSMLFIVLTTSAWDVGLRKIELMFEFCQPAKVQY